MCLPLFKPAFLWELNNFITFFFFITKRGHMKYCVFLGDTGSRWGVGRGPARLLGLTLTQALTGHLNGWRCHTHRHFICKQSALPLFPGHFSCVHESSILLVHTSVALTRHLLRNNLQTLSLVKGSTHKVSENTSLSLHFAFKVRESTCMHSNVFQNAESLEKK